MNRHENERHFLQKIKDKKACVDEEVKDGGRSES